MNRSINIRSESTPQHKNMSQNTKRDIKTSHQPQIDVFRCFQASTKHQFSKFDADETIPQTPHIQSVKSSIIKSSNQIAVPIGNNRLKLKDYLHIRSIQKKSRVFKSRQNANNQSQNKQASKPHDEVVDKSKLLPLTSISISTPPKQDINKQLPHPTTTNSLLKLQIQKQLKQQIGKLNSLSQYITDDFIQAPSPSSDNQTTSILYSISKSIMDNDNHLNEMGKLIVNYENKFEYENKRRYFWNQIKLQSPAKMLNRGLEITHKTNKFLEKFYQKQ